MKKVENYTDGTYLQNNPQYHVGDSPWKASHILSILRRNGLEASLIMEVGCGAGEILVSLQNQLRPSTSFLGYDPNPDLQSFWDDRQNDKLKFSTLDPLEAEVEFADVGLCMDVFEHVPDYLGFIKSFKTKAQYKVFHIPLDLSVQSVLRVAPLKQVRASAGHLHYYTKDTALASLEHAGLEVVDWFYTQSSVDLGNCLRTSIANLPRRVLYPFCPDLAVRMLGGYSMLVLAR